MVCYVKEDAIRANGGDFYNGASLGQCNEESYEYNKKNKDWFSGTLFFRHFFGYFLTLFGTLFLVGTFFGSFFVASQYYI